jgi:hypothetical protein
MPARLGALDESGSVDHLWPRYSERPLIGVRKVDRTRIRYSVALDHRDLLATVPRLRCVRERAASIALLAIVAFAVVNFVLLITATPTGSALAGRRDGNHYFLVNHGERVEVDQATWEARRSEEIALLITFPVVILAIKFGLGRAGRWH